MKLIARLTVLLMFLTSTLATYAQSNWRDVYNVKKKDTIYGIARAYGLTVDELVAANPEMKQDGFKLKKGMFVFIPYKQEVKAAPTMKKKAGETVNVGVLLPLHDVDGDGKRMTEYYRGVLMACDSLRTAGISTHIQAVNLHKDANVEEVLAANDFANCDVVFGPLYTNQVPALAGYCRQHDVKMVIPFSISGNDVDQNDYIYKVYQTPEEQNEHAIEAFLERFPDAHTVVIDCNDTTSRKGIFTFNLRKRIEQRGTPYSITNLKQSDEAFAKAFSLTKHNVVVLNTGRSPELNAVMAKLNTLTQNNNTLQISMFGYTEWLMYEKNFLELFHRYDAYVPSLFYYNGRSVQTQALEANYSKWFGMPMQQNALPRFAITGYDQAQYFIRGIYENGTAFDGSQNHYKQMQTPLNFVRVAGGGWRNTAFMLVHYRPDHSIETVNY